MKELEWRADTKAEFASWPLSKDVRARFISALRSLQEGDRDVPSVKWLKGFDRVAEVKISGYRVIAACVFDDAVYVVNSFKKDSARGRQTRKHELELVIRRVKELRRYKESGKLLN